MKHILLYKVMDSAYSRDMAAGVGDYARESQDWHLHFANNDPRLLKQLAKIKVAGALVFDTDTGPLVQYVNPPQMVSVYGQSSHPTVSYVTIDNRAVGSLVAREFLARGFRQFGYLGISGNVASDLRADGFRAWLEKKGLGVEVLDLAGVPRPDEIRRAHDPLSRWVCALPKPAAVMTFNDHMGWYLIEACSDNGIRIPHELAVIGVDNEIPVCSLSNPQLASVKIPSRAIGYRAAQILDQNIRTGRREASPTRLFPPTGIALRQSCDALAVNDLEIGNVLAFILANPGKVTGVDTLAKRFGISKRSLQRRFSTEAGTTITDVVQHARMREASRLLLATNLPVNQIGATCGFEYPHHFSRVFKKEMGCCPGEYRVQFNPK